MVIRKELYRQKNGVGILKVYCKPTRVFPDGGFFYAPAEAIDLVDEYNWCLCRDRKRVQVIAYTGSAYCQSTILFHKGLFKLYQGYDHQGDVDHIDIVEFDNSDENLNAVTHQQNKYNTLTRGYYYSKAYKNFQSRVMINGTGYYPFSVTHREDEACIQANYLEQVYLHKKLQDSYYMFNFFKYRRGSEDILDLERTGMISEEEAIYRHILRYADNAWYYYRYNLEQYFKDNHIPVPQYSLDDNGFMIHPITGDFLCPIPYLNGVSVERRF